MFSFFSKQKSTTATINSQRIEVQPKETLLQAALKHGIPFPNSCRVGGCGTCKCQLLQGKVKELTEAAYVLSEKELDDGFILACQSIPTSDVIVTVDTERKVKNRRLKLTSGNPSLEDQANRTAKVDDSFMQP